MFFPFEQAPPYPYLFGGWYTCINPQGHATTSHYCMCWVPPATVNNTLQKHVENWQFGTRQVHRAPLKPKPMEGEQTPEKATAKVLKFWQECGMGTRLSTVAVKYKCCKLHWQLFIQQENVVIIILKNHDEFIRLFMLISTMLFGWGY